ncbi:MBL fold metallo-hydrolase [Natrononativus amylolyticus]|uniref:MBL fold metallo-hydrolase n=1 Tax=Natrononativus amylolyticus TaxID=2963434 RepID=UPI0020CD7790|nr:MBL fold metallo-hydrolase [Natrononativus amylolyticus]
MTADPIPVGTGTPEGHNTAYLLADHDALVDPGPPTADARRDLLAGLERREYDVRDLESVLVTHWHADHAGLAPELAAAAEATIAMGAADAPLVAEYATERERRLERDAETMARWGVPPAVVEAVVAGDEPSPMPDSVPVDALADGETIAGLEVVATPGHTLGHVAFASASDLLVGDAALPTYTPNVGGSDTRTSDPLADYERTLERLDSRAETLRPGHGTALEADRIAEIRSHNRERTDRIREALEERGAATPWELAGDLFGDLEGVHAKFGAGEAAAHLAALEREGAAESRLEDGGRVYDAR